MKKSKARTQYPPLWVGGGVLLLAIVAIAAFGIRADQNDLATAITAPSISDGWALPKASTSGWYVLIPAPMTRITTQTYVPLGALTTHTTLSKTSDTSSSATTGTILPASPPSPVAVPLIRMAALPSNLSGVYSILVKKTASLSTASSIVTQAGGSIFIEYPLLRAFDAKLTSSEAAALAKNANILAIGPEQYVSPRDASSGACALPSPQQETEKQETTKSTNTKAPNGPVNVAIVDTGTHGNLALASAAEQCAAIGPTCTNNVTFTLYNASAYPGGAVSADDSGVTSDSLNNAIIQATAAGNNIVSVSYGADLSNPVSQTADLNALAFAKTNNSIIVNAAGEGNSGDDGSVYSGSATGAEVVTVGALDPNTNASAAGATIEPWSGSADMYADSGMPDVSSDYFLSAQDARSYSSNIASGIFGTSGSAPRAAAEIATTMALTGTQNDPAQAVDATKSSDCNVSTNNTATGSNSDGNSPSNSAVNNGFNPSFPYNPVVPSVTTQEQDSNGNWVDVGSSEADDGGDDAGGAGAVMIGDLGSLLNAF